MKFCGMCVLVAVMFGSTSAQNRQASLAEVIAVENSFADRAAESGTRAAFLAFAAEDGVIFTQKPENAKENWSKRPVNNAFLDWRPAWADVSDDGMLGYTTGPWAFSGAKDQAPTTWGEYFTIWKKQPDGAWRFMIDLGIQHDKADVIMNAWKAPKLVGIDSQQKYPTDIWQGLEKKLSELSAKIGVRKVYEKLASDQIRVLRDGQLPIQGKAALLGQVGKFQANFQVLGGGTSGNLAYAYGQYNEINEKGFYLRVWKNETKEWRIVADVTHLLPK